MNPQAARDRPEAGADVKPARCPVWVPVCAGASLLLYLLLPRVAAMLSSARPSRAGEVFPWVAKVTDASLYMQHYGIPPVYGEVWFFLVCAALFLFYGLLLRSAKGCQSARAQALIFWGGAVCLLTLLFSPVMLSADTYAYAFYGRVVSVHGSNPYAPDPSVASDPYFNLFNRQSLVSLYGPLWTLISAWITRLTGNHVGLTVLAFRVFSALSTLAAAGLIWAILRIHAPERAAQGLAMFLWNPLVMVESGLSGHNDATMVAFAALAVWFHLKGASGRKVGAKIGAVAALVLSAMVKFITGMLVPLYMLMVLRAMRSWRERVLFVLASGAAVAVVTVAILIPANVKLFQKTEKSDVPAQSQAMSPAFYMNNFHELIFKWLRARLGENTEPLMAPADKTFEPWWAVANKDTELYTRPQPEVQVKGRYSEMRPDRNSEIAAIPKGRKLIVITPTLIPWLRVYDSGSGKLGYVYKLNTDKSPAPAPAQLDADPKLAQYALPMAQWPTVVTANRWIRIVTWGLFAIFGLVGAWKTTDIDRFLIWSAVVLLASFYLVMTQIWPWYLVWALAFGAMKPGRLPARLALLMSACVLTYYITLDYDGTDRAWIYDYRSLPAIVLPLVLFLFTLVARRSAHGEGEAL